MRIDLPEEQRDNPVAHLAEHFAPEIVRTGMAFSTSVYQHSTLSLREFEAARVRTAEINGCMVCQIFRAARDLPGYMGAFGGDVGASVAARGPVPDEAFYRNVTAWRDYPDYSRREQLAIAYAEGMGLDPHGIAVDESFWGEARTVFSDDEIVGLTYAIASWMGMGRAAHVLGMDAVCAMVPMGEAVGA